MRLLNTRTVTLETFIGKSVPGYAILSHTWAEEEILFEDMQTANGHLPTHKKGYAKVRDSCSQAQRDGHKYIWIDTCCIDKSSSAELSEAINSMFNWYRSSSICYAYLIDVQEGNDNSFKQSRWFTRGWTLQELIAPTRVEFYDQTWCKLGERKSMASLLSKITGIDEGLLSGNYDPDCSHGKLSIEGPCAGQE
ncbi:HET-domain-containing protein [Cenococcum geophilum]